MTKNNFNKKIFHAINALKMANYDDAYKYLQQAIVINPHSPIVQNLYGVLSELMLNDDLACKHYRAAYALDPTYKSARRNLERITSFGYRSDKNDIDFGDKTEAECEIPFVIQYDDRNVGHLIKKEME